MNPDFDTARAAFLAGLQSQQAGRLDEAEAHYSASLAALPGRASTLTNLAATLITLARPDEALPLLAQVLAQDPADLQALAYRGLALAALQRDTEALPCFERVVQAGGANPAAWLQHALCLARLNRPDAALPSCQRVLDAEPDSAEAWALRGGLLKDLGQVQAAIEALRRAVALGANAGIDTGIQRYLLASLQGRGAPPQPPQAYVQGLFDGYAAGFEHHLLHTLRYRAHTVLTEAVAGAVARRGRPFQSALDLGCGSGLCGAALRPQVQALHGVDLSPAMLQQAAARDVYDTLTLADVATHLQSTAQRHDLVLAADVFIYIGDLEAVFAGVRRVLLPGGRLGFSVEQADDAADWLLQPSARYAQSARYLRTLARRHGFTLLQMAPGAVRHEQQQPVAGLYAWLEAPT